MPEWYGTLNLENLEGVANRILEKLDGKRYTFVSCNEYFNFEPKVRTGQQLDHKGSTSGNALSVWVEETYAAFNFGDTYGAWGCSTSRKESGYDPDFNSPYVVIEYNQVKITHRAPTGHLLYWVMAVES